MFKKRLWAFVSNIVAIVLAFLIAYTFRFGWQPEDSFMNINDALVLSYLVLCYVIVFMFFKGSNTTGRRGLLALFKDAFLNTMFVAALFYLVTIYLITFIVKQIEKSLRKSDLRAEE